MLALMDLYFISKVDCKTFLQWKSLSSMGETSRARQCWAGLLLTTSHWSTVSLKFLWSTFGTVWFRNRCSQLNCAPRKFIPFAITCLHEIGFSFTQKQYARILNASLIMIIVFYSITAIFGEFAITKAETSLSISHVRYKRVLCPLSFPFVQWIKTLGLCAFIEWCLVLVHDFRFSFHWQKYYENDLVQITEKWPRQNSCYFLHCKHLKYIENLLSSKLISYFC